MANIYVRSTDGSDADSGATWALAKATLAGAFAIASAGDTIYVSQAHAETQASAMTLISPGTATNPVRVLCANDGAAPPTALATTATVSTTGTNSIVFSTGFAYVYGISFFSATGSGNNSLQFNGAGSGWSMEACLFSVGTTSSSARIILSVSTLYVEWNNCSVSFSSASQAIATTGVRFVWRNTASAVAGTIPTTLFIPGNSASAEVYVSGVDLSAVTGALVNIASNHARTLYYFRNCKLGAGVSAISGTIAAPGATQVYVDNCDSADTNYRMEHYKLQGSIRQETTIVRTSGASDGTTPISHKMVSLASGPTLFSPLEGPWMSIWNDSTGSKTVTVEILHDSVTALTDAEVWLEVEYLGTSGFPLSSYAHDRVADAFASAADQTSSAASWTTTGLTNPNKQKLAVTFTVNEKGPIRARVMLAKPNYTVYVDPNASVGSGPSISRSYLVAGGPYINETAEGGGGSAFPSQGIQHIESGVCA